MALQTLGGKKITVETEKENVHFTYSMSEKWTGDYWIDGKKIYTKILKITGSNTAKQHITSSLNITNMSQCWIDNEMSYARIRNAGSSSVPISCSVTYKSISGWYEIATFVDFTNKVIDVNTNANTGLVEMYVCLKYTCTDK